LRVDVTFGIVVYPGSNCDHDVYWGLKKDLGLEARFIWHRQRDLEGADVVILPGGFAHGDYLRAGAIARFSPIMEAVVEHARQGRPVIGICNGFQVLTEIGLLPGALLRNESLRFAHGPVYLATQRQNTRFTRLYSAGQIIELPIAHGQGRYYAPPEILAELEAGGQVLFRYCDAAGKPVPAANPNGSQNGIAGICNVAGNVMGMMPHPERRMQARLGGVDGQPLFLSVAQSV
jgi:phosphoribosylformylglycinamidine synthase